MQKITAHLQVDGIKGERIDAEGNLTRNKIPEITRGMETELLLKFRTPEGIPWSNLEDYGAWEFFIGNDWDPETPVMLAVTSGISAADDHVIIPVRNTNTAELAEALGKSEKVTFHGELLGFISGSAHPARVVQFEIAVRNRVAASGTEYPELLPEQYLTAGAVTALVREQTRAMMPSVSSGNTWVVAGSDTGISVSGPAGTVFCLRR